MPANQAGQKCALVTYKAVVPQTSRKYLTEGSGAYGKRLAEEPLSLRGESGHCLDDFAPHRPKSVLAARMDPERLT